MKRIVYVLIAFMAVISVCSHGAWSGPIDRNSNGATTNVLAIPFTNNARDKAMIDFCITINDPTDADRVISSVKWAGTNATFGVGADQLTSDKGTQHYYLLNPFVGSGSAVVTTAGVCNGLAMSVTSWNGIKQVGQPDAVNAATNTSSSTPSVTITSLVKNALIIDSYNKFTTTAPVTFNGGRTVIGNTNVGASHWMATTYFTTAPTNGIYRFLYTNGTAAASADAIISYIPAEDNQTLSQSGVGQ